jgi:hypothetical protein
MYVDVLLSANSWCKLLVNQASGKEPAGMVLEQLQVCRLQEQSQ